MLWGSLALLRIRWPGISHEDYIRAWTTEKADHIITCHGQRSQFITGHAQELKHRLQGKVVISTSHASFEKERQGRIKRKDNII